MLLSDNISSLLNTKENTNIPYKVNPDIYYLPHTKAHLEKNKNYRQERREWAKTQHTECVAWGLFRIKDEFCIKYLDPFHEDIDKFVGYYPGLSPKDIAEKFCKSWKLYNDMFGPELIERAIILSMWRNPETSSTKFEIGNLTDKTALKRNYTSVEKQYLLTPSIFFSPDCPAFMDDIDILTPGSILHSNQSQLTKGIFCEMKIEI